ncbi:hypothetical protein [Rhizobium rhizogenes]|uniref:hypothetical protein n=1 Tax=Rhizobium rhizogenes TaxID=359 RepID=UPI0004D4F831|nr:hypothetical protein [Rhizobium rhizogenes]KEA07177.1 hypothetical protein CN09_09600 [Rhizobium rhizogenes]NTI80377.1 hypothetical protein [Rhizobium rhizogenes]NTJ22563.1 hypothetical protein [Rhizobium rhizogenes]QUE81269.1 hypothetical protein EML492_05535 [Rhizobium rhizogenes]TQO80631.1 hypothetical protein FFE80_05885 [Rhizobium rhizogenes]
MSIRLIQDLHAGISRHDWEAVETAANRLRDEIEQTIHLLAGTGNGGLPNDYPLSKLATDALNTAPEIAAARQAERDLCNDIVRKAWGDKISVDAMAEISVLRVENERLRKALEPFAKAPYMGANAFNRAALSDQDFRRARAAVAPEQEEAK